VAYPPNLAVAFDVMMQRRIFAIEDEYPVQALDPLTTAISEIQQEIRGAIELMRRVDHIARQGSARHDCRLGAGDA
jgi:hypothetical protein